MTLFIISCATAVIVSFLCSLMEAVLLSLNSLRLQTLQHQGHKHAAIWLGMVSRGFPSVKPWRL